jgi:hypothetical protein
MPPVMGFSKSEKKIPRENAALLVIAPPHCNKALAGAIVHVRVRALLCDLLFLTTLCRLKYAPFP